MMNLDIRLSTDYIVLTVQIQVEGINNYIQLTFIIKTYLIFTTEIFELGFCFIISIT